MTAVCGSWMHSGPSQHRNFSFMWDFSFLLSQAASPWQLNYFSLSSCIEPSEVWDSQQLMDLGAISIFSDQDLLQTAAAWLVLKSREIDFGTCDAVRLKKGKKGSLSPPTHTQLSGITEYMYQDHRHSMLVSSCFRNFRYVCILIRIRGDLSLF